MSNSIHYDDDAERASIFTVPVRRIRPHFWTFSICFVTTTLFYIYIHAIDTENPSWRDAPAVIMGAAVSAAGFWIVLSPILVEGAAMVFAAMFTQRKRQEAEEKGREEGHAAGLKEADTEWREWNRRREEAISKGQPFEEPTPDSRNGSGSTGG